MTLRPARLPGCVFHNQIVTDPRCALELADAAYPTPDAAGVAIPDEAFPTDGRDRNFERERRGERPTEQHEPRDHKGLIMHSATALMAAVEVGGYVSILKLIPVLIILLAFARLMTWIDKDADVAHLPRQALNSGIFIAGIAGVAAFFTLPLH